MPTGQSDISAQLRVYPYVAPPGASAKKDAEDKKKDLDDFISSLSEFSSSIPDGLSFNPVTSPKTGTDQWLAPDLMSPDQLKELVKAFAKPVEALSSAVMALQKIMTILQLFISSFNSFSKLIVSFINFGQAKLNEYADDTLKSGIFANILVPPAFLQTSRGDAKALLKAQGGFDGFMSRLDSSIKNTRDINRPVYGVQDYVGGLVILLDSESLDDIWEGLKQLAAMFDFMQLFGLNLEPPPPTNVRGFSGFFEDPEIDEGDEEREKFGIQLEWDKSPITGAFKVYRSRVQGGVPAEVEYRPTSLVDNKATKEPGLLTMVRRRFAKLFRKEPFIIPTRIEYVYADEDFNGGEPVLVEATRGGTTMKFVDTYIPTEEIVIDGKTYEVPYHFNSNPEVLKRERVLSYYYVIKSSTRSGNIDGPYSKELIVDAKSCNDNYNLADVIPHADGQVEYFSKGFGAIGSWSSIQLSKMIPWFGDVIKILNKFLDTLKGMVTDASDSFSDFLNQITEKFQMYVGILQLVSWLLEEKWV